MAVRSGEAKTQGCGCDQRAFHRDMGRYERSGQPGPSAQLMPPHPHDRPLRGWASGSGRPG